MALNYQQHIAWEQILSLADKSGMKEGVADGNVPAGTGLTQLITMYESAEGGAHAQALQAVARLTTPSQR